MANEYYLHDAENGKPQTAMQLWRDSHTENDLAEKIRRHLESKKGGMLTRVAAVGVVALSMIGCVNSHEPGKVSNTGYVNEETWFKLADGTPCVQVTGIYGIACDFKPLIVETDCPDTPGVEL